MLETSLYVLALQKAHVEKRHIIAQQLLQDSHSDIAALQPKKEQTKGQQPAFSLQWA